MKTPCQKTLSRIMQYGVVWLVVFDLFALPPALVRMCVTN